MSMIYVGAGPHIQDGLHLDHKVNDATLAVLRQAIAISGLCPKVIGSAMVGEGLVVLQTVEIVDGHHIETSKVQVRLR